MGVVIKGKVGYACRNNMDCCSNKGLVLAVRGWGGLINTRFPIIMIQSPFTNYKKV